MPLTIAQLKAAIAKYARAPKTARNVKALARNRELLAGRVAEAKAETNIAKLQRQADEFVIARRNKLDAAQQASLDKLNTRIAKLRVLAQPPGPDGVDQDVVLLDIGSSPLTNNSLPLADGLSYACDVNRAEFTSRYGASPQVILSRVLTARLRPKATTFDHITDRKVRNQSLQAYLTVQTAVRDWFAGRVPFGEITGYLAGWEEIFGCAPLSELRDLGPS